MKRGCHLHGWLSAILLILSAAPALAVDILKINLDPLIDAAANDRNRFAVTVPHTISTAQMGTWSVSGVLATWHYSLQVPTAVSLSFHATNTFLPPSAQLIVRGGGSTYTYRAADANRHEIWSRISKGDSLDLQITVAAQERRDVVLQISSLQAGYRGFGHAVGDHPHYARLKQQARVASTSTCIVNYGCDVAAANLPAGQATVAIIVDNSYQCTGTLLNDVPHDGKPYILTARHCQTGKLGGGNSDAAADVVVYWDAMSACGSPLGTLYDPGIPVQQGATTVAEQQDAWLLLLNTDPVVNDAYLSGFDATGGAIQDGYTVHHALSNNKQFTAWNGQASAGIIPSSTLNVEYQSNFWEVVNRIGTIGPGASGSGLFDQNNRLVGSLSLGGTAAATDDGYDACPSAPPPNPNILNASAFFTALSAVWNSTADPTSHTRTIRQVLDPNSTALLVVNSMRAPASARISASEITLTVGFDVTLTWSAPGASTCIASGGNSGDGWAGPLPIGSNQVIRESVIGAVTFAITCAFPDGHTSKAQTVVTWAPPDPMAHLIAPPRAWVGGTWTLTWSTNSPPCQLIGGSASQYLSGTYGMVSIKETTAGTYDYHINCGTGSQATAQDAYVAIVPPVIRLIPATTDLRLGQVFELGWDSPANSCTPAGGAPNDGWSQTQAAGIGDFSFLPTSAGTYTYSITCSQGAATAQAEVTITVEDDPPYANLTVNTDQIAVGQAVTVSYKSNIAECTLHQNAIGAQSLGIYPASSTGGPSEGTRTYSGGNVGASQLILSCGTNPTIVSSAPRIVTVVGAVSASISAPPTATTGSVFTLSWQTSNASSCSAAGSGADANQWSGSVAVPSGQQNITATVAGTLTYTLTCVGQIPTDTNTANVAINVSAPVSQSPPPADTSGGGSSGGGGACDPVTLALLALVGLAQLLNAFASTSALLANSEVSTPTATKR